MGKGMLAKLGGIGVAIVIALGFFAFNMIKEKASAPEVGECVILTGGSDTADVETKECGAETLWKVASDDGKCDETETSYFVEVRGAKAADLCLTYDLSVGECFESVDDTSTIEKPAACTAKAPANGIIIKTTKVNPDSEKIKCGKKAVPVGNVTRHTSVCIAPAA